MVVNVKTIKGNVFDNVNISLLCAIFFKYYIKHDRCNKYFLCTLVHVAKMNLVSLNFLSLKSSLNS